VGGRTPAGQNRPETQLPSAFPLLGVSSTSRSLSLFLLSLRRFLESIRSEKKGCWRTCCVSCFVFSFPFALSLTAGRSRGVARSLTLPSLLAAQARITRALPPKSRTSSLRGRTKPSRFRPPHLYLRPGSPFLFPVCLALSHAANVQLLGAKQRRSTTLFTPFPRIQANRPVMCLSPVV
jgi:hypothetical protein